MRENYLPLLRGNLISRYVILSEPKEYVPISIEQRGHYKIERIVFQEVANQNQKRRIKAILINSGYFCGHTTNYCFSIKKEYSNKAILGLLNSSLVNYYFSYFNNTNHVPIGEIKNIPIPKLDLTDKKQKAQHDLMVSLVTQMLESQKLAHNVQSESDKSIYKQRIEILDKQIDQIVYQLYGLTEEEIELLQ